MQAEKCLRREMRRGGCVRPIQPELNCAEQIDLNRIKHGNEQGLIEERGNVLNRRNLAYQCPSAVRAGMIRILLVVIRTVIGIAMIAVVVVVIASMPALACCLDSVCRGT